MSNELGIMVASHKPYWMPQDPIYLPTQVGAFDKPAITGFQRDDEGENISKKNPRYCELTALYWGWQNTQSDYLGLSHYRRHFAGSGERGIANEQDMRKLLDKSPVILPYKRRYFIETIESHYAHTFDQSHLDVLRGVLEVRSPEILAEFDEHMRSRSAHIWNMMVMRRDVLNEWCTWLFPILDEVEQFIDFSNMTPFEARVIGRLSERLLDPWLASRSIGALEMPVTSLEKTDWVKKGSAFLQAKLLGRPYTESF